MIYPAPPHLPYDDCGLLIAIMPCSSKGLFSCTVSFYLSPGLVFTPSHGYLWVGTVHFCKAHWAPSGNAMMYRCLWKLICQKHPCPLSTWAWETSKWQMGSKSKLSFMRAFKIKVNEGGSGFCFLVFLVLALLEDLPHPVSSVCAWSSLHWHFTWFLGFSGHRNCATAVSSALSKRKIKVQHALKVM